MAAARSWWPLAIDLTIGVPDIGQAARITCGGQATGYGGTVGKCGSAAITSCEDTNPRPVPRCRDFSRLPSRDQATQQTEKSADERFKKIMAPQVKARPDNEKSQREGYRADDRIDHEQNDPAIESEKRVQR